MSLVLVVEDNPTNQLLIQQQLKFAGFEAAIAENGKVALNLLEPGKYSVLLTDINMPDMNGYELTQHVRASSNPQIANLPIIAITANSTEADRKKCLAAGMDEYLAKPVDLNVLKSTIEHLLNMTSIARQEAEKHDDGVLTETTSLVLDIHAVASFVGNNDVMIKKIFTTFMEQTHEIINDIESARRHNYMDGIVFSTHKLKSSARSVGANILANMCVALESAAKLDDRKTVDKIGNDLEQAFTDVKTAILEHCG